MMNAQQWANSRISPRRLGASTCSINAALTRRRETPPLASETGPARSHSRVRQWRPVREPPACSDRSAPPWRRRRRIGRSDPRKAAPDEILITTPRSSPALRRVLAICSAHLDMTLNTPLILTRWSARTSPAGWPCRPCPALCTDREAAPLMQTCTAPNRATTAPIAARTNSSSLTSARTNIARSSPIPQRRLFAPASAFRSSKATRAPLS